VLCGMVCFLPGIRAGRCPELSCGPMIHVRRICGSAVSTQHESTPSVLANAVSTIITSMLVLKNFAAVAMPANDALAYTGMIMKRAHHITASCFMT